MVPAYLCLGPHQDERPHPGDSPGRAIPSRPAPRVAESHHAAVSVAIGLVVGCLDPPAGSTVIAIMSAVLMLVIIMVSDPGLMMPAEVGESPMTVHNWYTRASLSLGRFVVRTTAESELLDATICTVPPPLRAVVPNAASSDDITVRTAARSALSSEF